MNGKPEQTSESGNGYHDKPKLTIAQQIAHLEAKGVTFDRYSKERAAAYLSDECDFYELTSYRKLFAKRQGGKRNGEYANLDFAQLVIFAELDEMLREVLFVMTRHIEHSCKVDLKRNISERNDEDGYAIVADYMASLTPKSRSYREAELERNGRNKYTKAVTRNTRSACRLGFSSSWCRSARSSTSSDSAAHGGTTRTSSNPTTT